MNFGDGFTLWSDFVQVFILFLAGAIAYFEFWRLKKKNGGEITEPLLMIIWMLHTIIFYIVVLLEDLQWLNIVNEGQFFTTWSSALRLHGYTSLFVITFLRVNRRKLIRQQAEGILYGSNSDE